MRGSKKENSISLTEMESLILVRSTAPNPDFQTEVKSAALYQP